MLPNEDEVSVREILLRIRNREVEPKTLEKETRLACVETLVLDGQEPATIAQFLKKSDRTIRRDIEEIRNSYSVKRDSSITNSIISEFIFNSKVNIAHLNRLARSKGATVGERSRAEALAFKINKEVVQELSYLGLPFFLDEKVKETVEVKEQKPLTEDQKKIMECMDPISALEKMILVERLERAAKGKVQKSRFSSDDSNGQSVLDDLVKKGILEVVDLTTVRLIRKEDQPIKRPEEMSGKNFDIIWSILIWPYEEEERVLKGAEKQSPVSLEQKEG